MVTNIRKNINILQNKIKELRSNGVTDDFQLELYVIDNMPELYDTYPSLVKRLCRNDKQDNSFLFKMIDMIESVDNGKQTMASIEHTLGNELAEKYLYPVLKKNK